LRIRLVLVAALSLLLAACGADSVGVPGNEDDTQPFSAIGEDDSISLTGTEPFWGGEVGGGRFLYTTPENIDGVSIPVERFAGRAGVSFTGTLDGSDVVLAVTEGECSDGMSDRTYPYTATLSLGDDLRGGCAWTEDQPFTGPAAP
jgi:uncharacterized membrane protein